jgi:N4-gp56 family major capsid protein
MPTMTTSTAGLLSQYQDHFSKDLLKYAIQELRLNEFAQKAKLPKNVGSKTISLFRFGEASSSHVQTLVEGVTPGVTREVALTKIDITLTQYGELAKITDVMGMVQLFDGLKQAITSMGEDAALKADDITRDEVVTNGVKRYSQANANYAALAAATVANAKFLATDVLDIVTRLKVNRAHRIRGNVVCVLPPQISRDVQNDPDWKEASKYAGATQIFKGELGMLHGCIFVEATNPFIENSAGAEGTYDANGNIFSSIFTGADAFGCAELSGESPFSPRVIITKGADKSDPLDQLMTAGWKSFNAAKLLNANWCRVYKAKTAFVG